MKIKLLTFLLFFFPIFIFSQNYVPGLRGIATFESIGLYFNVSSGNSSTTAELWYKKSTESNWRRGHDLWFDNRNDGAYPEQQQYRGSLVNLEPGTEYNIEVRLQNKKRDTGQLTISTWSEDFPIAKTIYLPEYSNKTLTIKDNGNKNGYILYTHAPNKKAIINGENKISNCIVITGSYIIIKDVILKGATENGIKFPIANVSNVIIDNCDISKWGTTEKDGFGQNENAAIFGSWSGTTKNIIIQNCKIHHPNTKSNSWAEYRKLSYNTYHPTGPKATALHSMQGGLVIRNNEVFSDKNHYFNDIFGSGSNYSFEGFPNRDADIYNNKISQCWDDGIESEGANMNVRIWGNFITDTFTKIAIATVSKGPLYIWNNISGKSRKSALTNDSDKYERGPFIKAGGLYRKINGKNVWVGSGRTYIYHNTILQPQPENGKKVKLGASNLIAGSGGKILNMVTRNNIFLGYKSNALAIVDEDNGNVVTTNTNDFDYDLFMGRIRVKKEQGQHETHGITIKNNNAVHFNNPEDGDYSLTPNSAGYEAGIRIYNFNDNYIGKAPSMGVFYKNSQQTIKTPIYNSTTLEAPSNFSITSNERKVYLQWDDPNKETSLITKGWNFNNKTDLNFWEPTYTNTASIVNNRLKITDNGSSKWTSVTRTINNLEIGKEYYFHDELLKGTADYVGVYIVSKDKKHTYLDYRTNKNNILDTLFIAKSTSVKIFLQIENGKSGNYGFHDNIKLQKINKKYTGYEVWIKKYSTPSNSWVLHSSINNYLKKSYQLNVPEYGKYGFKIRFFLSQNNNKLFSNFSKEKIITTTSNSINFNNFYSKIKVFLEGPFKNDLMETNLVNKGYLPYNQPFNNSRFNYTAFKKVRSFPNTIVDWVLVELRSDLTTTVQRFPALLNNDGFLFNLDGSNSFTNLKIPDGKYYLVIQHRNHLPIMSAEKIDIKNSIINYDFTESINKAYGKNPMVKLPNGKYAMFAGDGDGNKKIDNSDYTIVKDNILLAGYENGDYDLNGIVNVLDFSKVNKNISHKSNVQ